MALLGWLGAGLNAYNQQQAGAMRGRAEGREALRKRTQEDEDRERQRQMDVLQMALLQSNITKANQGPQAPWTEAGFAEEGTYLDHVRRHKDATRADNPTNWTTTTLRDGRVVQVHPETGEFREVGKSGAPLKAPQGPGRPRQRTMTEEANEAKGLAILGSEGDPRVTGAVGKAFRELRKKKANMSPGLVANAATEGVKMAQPGLFRAGDPEDPTTWDAETDPGRPFAADTLPVGATPATPATAPKPQLPTLTNEERSLAGSDPAFRAFLKQQGYSDREIGR